MIGSKDISQSHFCTFDQPLNFAFFLKKLWNKRQISCFSFGRWRSEVSENAWVFRIWPKEAKDIFFLAERAFLKTHTVCHEIAWFFLVGGGWKKRWLSTAVQGYSTLKVVQPIFCIGCEKRCEWRQPEGRSLLSLLSLKHCVWKWL